ncbi:hypothetical protein ATM17_10460 [Sphingopyxis macrogoltabida]|uniref:Uncharacterized protein n=1 Tax=Sphingopyxis macrogoltabida TaxID=33050 RepID=A0AAC8Z033_SPHMC|nr:hypothetical protein ATM17_10460 [Sphingopyxis macrogoltabida]
MDAWRRPTVPDGGSQTKKDGLPEGRPSLFVSVIAPKGCDLLLFFSRSSSLGVSSRSGSVGSRSSSGVSGRSGSSVGASSGSVGTSGSGVGASSSGVSAFFRNSFSSRGVGGGFFSSLFTASGEGEHAGSNGDSSKLLHDVWAP